jgi:ribonuclease VapC
VIVDSSALNAILLDEPERAAFEDAISGDLLPRISAASYLEAGIVIDGQGSAKRSRLLDSYYLRRASP